VLGSGAACAVTGIAVAAALPGGFWVAAPAALAWSLWVATELGFAWRRYRSTRAFTLSPDGGLEVELADGSRQVGRLAPGSVRLAHRAWVRVRLPGRGTWGEPVSVHGQDREQWRRFQVICRHIPGC
jgi:hypothetical protein